MSLEERIERLESENQRLRRELMALPVIGAGVVAIGAIVGGATIALSTLLAAGATALAWACVDRSLPDVIRARKIEIVGENGGTVVAMGETTDAGGAVATYDVHGRYIEALGAVAARQAQPRRAESRVATVSIEPHGEREASRDGRDPAGRSTALGRL